MPFGVKVLKEFRDLEGVVPAVARISEMKQNCWERGRALALASERKGEEKKGESGQERKGGWLLSGKGRCPRAASGASAAGSRLSAAILLGPASTPSTARGPAEHGGTLEFAQVVSVLNATENLGRVCTSVCGLQWFIQISPSIAVNVCARLRFLSIFYL